MYNPSKSETKTMNYYIVHSAGCHETAYFLIPSNYVYAILSEGERVFNKLLRHRYVYGEEELYLS